MGLLHRKIKPERRSDVLSCCSLPEVDPSMSLNLFRATAGANCVSGMGGEMDEIKYENIEDMDGRMEYLESQLAAAQEREKTLLNTVNMHKKVLESTTERERALVDAATEAFAKWNRGTHEEESEGMIKLKNVLAQKGGMGK